MIKDKQKFTLPIIVSILLHLCLFALLFVKFPHAKNQQAQNVDIIQAVAINESQLSKPSPTNLAQNIKPAPAIERASTPILPKKASGRLSKLL